NIGEENDGPAGQHAAPAVGHEGMPVGGMNEADHGHHKDQDGDELEAHHHVVGGSGFANAADQDDREHQNNEERWDIEAEVPAGMVEPVSRKVLQAVGKVGGRN